MNKSESKYFNTAVCMDKAFLELLENKDFAYITVKEICEKAGVNRSTFYLHYETIDDLLTESIQYMYDCFLTHMKENSIESDVVKRLRDCPVSQLNLITPEYLLPYLSYIKEHKRLFQTAVENTAVLRTQNTYDKMFNHVFAPILDRLSVPEQDRHYIMAFHIRGLMAIITEWLKDGCADSIDHVITVIQKCIIQL